MLGLINVVLNVIQIGLMGKKALESESGKNIIKKTSDVSKSVASAGIGAGVSACCQVSKMACNIKNEVGNCLNKKSQHVCKKVCDCKVCDCNDCDSCDCVK